MPEHTHVFLVDDDDAVLDALGGYLEMKGLTVTRFPCADAAFDLLSQGRRPDCIVSDVRMPGRTGLELQRDLTGLHDAPPLILITGHGDVPMAVESIKAGAYDFIEKPFDEARLIASIESAVRARRHREVDSAADLSTFGARIAELSERQRAVMELAVQGLSSKEIGGRLGISPRTVDAHRAWVLERTGARNIAELIRLACKFKEWDRATDTAA